MQSSHHKSEEEEAFWCILADLSSRGEFRIRAPLRRGGHSNPLQYFCLENPMDRGVWRAIVHVISQARILEWVAISFSRRSSEPRDQTWVSCTAGGFFTN